MLYYRRLLPCVFLTSFRNKRLFLLSSMFDLHLFSNNRTELAVLASSPEVGSSRKSTEGSMTSSMPMLVLFLSPPEIPRLT